MDDSSHSFEHRLGSKFVGTVPYYKQEISGMEETSNKVKEMELALIENYS